MQSNAKDAWAELANYKLRPADVLAVLSEIGFKLPRKMSPDSSGWLTGLLMSPRIQTDRNPSVSVNVNTTAMKDFGSDWKSDLPGAIGDALGYDFKDSVYWLHSFLKQPYPEELQYHDKRVEKFEWFDKEVSRKTATYDYTNEHGEVIYHVDRYEGKGPFLGEKSFIPRLVGQRKSGGVTKEMRVPYRLHEVVTARAEGQAVFILEGEKDVDTLRDLGEVATTNMNGAGNWLDHYDKWFNDAYIIILPDNDSSGHNHSRMLIDRLSATSRAIWEIRLPRLAYKEDFTDWVNNRGGSLEELQSLVSPGDISTWRAKCRMADDEWLRLFLTNLCASMSTDEEDETLRTMKVAYARSAVNEAFDRIFDLKFGAHSPNDAKTANNTKQNNNE